jgi:hypothetical protein
VGFEPTRPFGHETLNLASLPSSSTAAWMLKSSGSSLASDVLEHQCQAVATVDPDIPTPAPIAVDPSEQPHPVTGSDEQVDDVPRHVAELVAQVLVRLMPWTSVRLMNAQPSVQTHARTNARASHQRAPSATARVKSGDAASEHHPKCSHLPEDGNAEPQRHRPVPTPRSEQLGIVLVGEPHRLGRPRAPRADCPQRLPHVAGAAPVADRAARDAQAAGDLAVVQTGLYECEGFGADLGQVQLPQFAGKVRACG